MEGKLENPQPTEDKEQQTASQLVPLVYDRLRQAARGLMAREGQGHSLQATALVHEAYLRVKKSDNQPQWCGPSHFSAIVMEVMRRILVESARRKKRLKHGGEMTRQDLDPGMIEGRGEDDLVLALDEALTELTAVNSGWANLVKLRYFLGLTMPEAARDLGVSPRTADAWWASARVWLQNRLALDIGELMK
ncbi:ECF-type sigma factor [Fimbriiglobus ruber]|uniref:RNA polymerase sigma-70 ECF-like HTH domain-containing protein n=1 Tax=Fimbriiglobus ruber TaxID=1908690 RepID=A0A225DI06_9BACT|nr:ECF-type sigma factor [Fimbriiglobus ruber]OWK41091.1 hypothetical protein FRUB_04983 [Fimbriiglobus ruber]